MTPAQLLAHRDAIERELCRRSLYAFLKAAWPAMDPAAFTDGWHLRAICQVLEKVARGEVRDQVICVPPRHSKSLIIAVAFPAWIWTWWPSCQFIATSYAAPLSIRDSVKMRRLVESPWYRRHWGGTVALVHDQNQKQYFQTTAGGHRFSTSVGGLLTGYGADIILCDDPHNVVDSESETTRTATVTWWREAVPTRLNDPRTGRKLVIQQRVHEKDVAGWCIGEGYGHLVLPAEFEADHPHRSSLDPRGRDGDLLWPARFGREDIDRLKRSLGSYAVAGQFQQRPAPRDGGMFKRFWFETVAAAPARARRVRRWDLAATSTLRAEDPDWTAGLRMARDEAGIVYIEDVRRLRETSWKVEQAILNTASADGKAVPIGMPQDPGAAGKAQAAYLVRQLAGYVVKTEPETGSKETRAAPFAAQAEAGNVKLVRGAWNDDFLDELCGFPNAAHDDMVDAAAGAFRMLVERGSTGLLDYYAGKATAPVPAPGSSPSLDPLEQDGRVTPADGVAPPLTRKD